MIFGPGPALLRTAAGRGGRPRLRAQLQHLPQWPCPTRGCWASALFRHLAWPQLTSAVWPMFYQFFRMHLWEAKRKRTPLSNRDPPKDLGKLPLLLNILNCASWCQPLPLSLHGHWAAFQGQPESKSVWCQGERGVASPPPSPQRADPPFHRGQEGRKSWGPQSSAPSSSVWGAPGGSSGSGVCSPR